MTEKIDPKKLVREINELLGDSPSGVDTDAAEKTKGGHLDSVPPSAESARRETEPDTSRAATPETSSDDSEVSRLRTEIAELRQTLDALTEVTGAQDAFIAALEKKLREGASTTDLLNAIEQAK